MFSHLERFNISVTVQKETSCTRFNTKCNISENLVVQYILQLDLTYIFFLISPQKVIFVSDRNDIKPINEEEAEVEQNVQFHQLLPMSSVKELTFSFFQGQKVEICLHNDNTSMSHIRAVKSIHLSPKEHRKLSTLFTGRRELNPLRRSKKFAWNTVGLQDLDPEGAVLVGEETCGYGDDGDDDVGDGGCWIPVTHFHLRCRDS